MKKDDKLPVATAKRTIEDTVFAQTLTRRRRTTKDENRLQHGRVAL